MPNFRLILEYDGEAFGGWQIQPEGQAARTVQGTLETAIARITGQRVRVVGSGRTDAGVHAEAQVAHVAIDTTLDAKRLRDALGGVLPQDLSALSVESVPQGFHARRDAVSKVYRYRIWNGEISSPLRRRYAAWFRRCLDPDLVRQASRDLLGTHDFASFQAAGSQVRSTTRTLSRLDVEGEARGEIDLFFEGNGFLRHMVRNIVGTLVEVGGGRREPGSMPVLLAARDRRWAGPTAPAQGLALVSVSYREFPEISGP